MDRQVLLPLLEDNMMQEVSVHITAAVAAAVASDLSDWIGNNRKHLVADVVWTFVDDGALAQQPHSLH